MRSTALDFIGKLKINWKISLKQLKRITHDQTRMLSTFVSVNSIIDSTPQCCTSQCTCFSGWRSTDNATKIDRIYCPVRVCHAFEHCPTGATGANRVPPSSVVQQYLTVHSYALDAPHYNGGTYTGTRKYRQADGKVDKLHGSLLETTVAKSKILMTLR